MTHRRRSPSTSSTPRATRATGYPHDAVDAPAGGGAGRALRTARGTSRSGRSRSTPTSWRSRSSRCASRARRASRCAAAGAPIPPSEMVVMLDPPRHGPVRRVANAGFTPRAVRGAARRHRTHRGRDPRRGDAGRRRRAISTSSSGSRRRSRSRVIAWILGVPRERLGAAVPVDQRGDRQGRSGVPPAGRDARPDRSSAPGARCTPTSSSLIEQRRARAAGRSGERADPRRDRRVAAHRRAARLVLRAARRGGQRDDPQRDHRRPARLLRAPRRVGEAAGAPGAAARRGRGDPALGQPDQPLHPHRHRGLRGSRRDRSAPASRSRCTSRRRTATRRCSTIPSRSASIAARTRISRSASASTSAWARTSRASSSRRSSVTCSRGSSRSRCRDRWSA